MNRSRSRILAPVLVFALVPMATAAGGLKDDDDEIPFDVAEVFVELNDTDGDLGIHALIDGEPWRRLSIETPNERKVMVTRIRGRLARQGLTELFFESAEPDFEELTPAQFFARFPQGIYEVEGMTLEGEELESETFFSHVMAAPPDNITVSGVPAAEDCDKAVPVVTTPVVISWDPVTTHHPEIGATGAVEVIRYQLVVEREEPELLVYSAELPPDVTSMAIPDEFISLADEFKYEILVRTATYNNTAVESCFALE